MLPDIHSPINPVLAKFTSAPSLVEVRQAMFPNGEDKSPEIQSFLGNSSRVREYLVSQFFREGWARLCNVGKFGNVWDEEYAGDRQRIAEARHVKSWPLIKLGGQRIEDVVADIHSSRDPHVCALWQLAGHAMPGCHPRKSLRREREAELVTA